jgi:hypothetical protein
MRLDYVAPAFVVVQSSGKRRVVVDFDKLITETLKSVVSGTASYRPRLER